MLTLLRGDAHCGYDPVATRTAPQCTPLATQLIHAAGLAYGEMRKGRGSVALAFVGDGATSEGDFHEALNFAAVFKAPVVFVVQNNKYAISVPLSKQTAAPSLSYKGIGYGIASEQVDGNDPMAVLAVLNKAAAHARSGNGPVLVELHTYRLDAAHQRGRRHALPRRGRGHRLAAARPDRPAGGLPARPRACSTTRRSRRSRPRPRPSPPTCAPA